MMPLGLPEALTDAPTALLISAAGRALGYPVAEAVADELDVRGARFYASIHAATVPGRYPVDIDRVAGLADLARSAAYAADLARSDSTTTTTKETTT